MGVFYLISADYSFYESLNNSLLLAHFAEFHFEQRRVVDWTQIEGVVVFIRVRVASLSTSHQYCLHDCGF